MQTKIRERIRRKSRWSDLSSVVAVCYICMHREHSLVQYIVMEISSLRYLGYLIPVDIRSISCLSFPDSDVMSFAMSDKLTSCNRVPINKHLT
jgi:hypothetical protein